MVQRRHKRGFKKLGGSAMGKLDAAKKIASSGESVGGARRM
jgi:hypothetical protein